MGKEKHGDDASMPAEIGSSDPAYNGYPISKHRSCWIHVVGYLRGCRKKISKQELCDIKLTAPCFLDSIQSRARSNRRFKSKNSIFKLKNKLDSGSFECYLRTIWSRFPEDKQTLFTYLDCQWFAWYRKAYYRKKFLSWIKRKEIFSKTYVLVPIVCWDHWSLLIFCHFGESLQSKTRTPCVLLLDSLQMSDPMRLEPDIRKFMFDIYKTEGRPENKQTIYGIPLLVPKVPQQRNGKECGNFVLYFIKLFVESAPGNFSIEDYPYFM
ncbi:probable ubiquitin-like-specific protease 2A [Hibiscus syriacus]|uniref:probable ubiquitin-like-specific protease 2A n=1 Tax=Hibiscus syriacus TaxID=106335 RepID=UPI001921F3DF|nr:probable ubiquitin-like-specific protease 2A [Hibiscus syriacus]